MVTEETRIGDSGPDPPASVANDRG
jgi:hypothetical protein